MEDRLTVLRAGHAAEEVVLGRKVMIARLRGGPKDDVELARARARVAVGELLGLLGLDATEDKAMKGAELLEELVFPWQRRVTPWRPEG